MPNSLTSSTNVHLPRAAEEGRVRRRSRAYRACLTAAFIVPEAASAQANPDADRAIYRQGEAGSTGSTYGSPNLSPNELLPYGTLLGEPGWRRDLLEDGIGFSASYTGEGAGNVAGERRAAAYAGQVAVSADFDLKRLMGADGLSFHTAMVNRHGHNLSAHALGDHLTLATEVYGETFGARVRLVQAFFEQRFANGRVNVAGGRLPFANDFATSVIACNAVSLAPACPIPAALAALPAFTAFPRAGWGFRARVRPGGGTYVQAGVFLDEIVPAGGPSGFDIGRNIRGTLLPVEIGLDTLGVWKGLPGHYKLGFAYDTATYPEVAIPPVSGLGPLVDGRSNAWAMFDQMVLSHGGRGRGLILAGSYSVAPSRTALVAKSVYLSLLDSGPLASRPHDVAQIAFGWYGVGSRTRRAQRLLLLGNGATSRLQTNEFLLEVNYTTSLLRGTSLQPAFQYFANPNAQRSLKDGVVFALRVTARL